MSHAAIDPRHTALVIIDLQNDFLAPDGAYARGGAVSAAAQALPPRVAAVAKALKAAGGMVVGSQFTLWPDAQGEPSGGMTVWSIGSGENFAAGKAFMVNYRVADLHALLAQLRSEGCEVLDKVDESEFGKFGWVVDPEGNKVELWEPPEGM